VSKFRLNGEPFEMNHIKPLILRVRAFVSKLPDDELLTTQELSLRLRMNYSNFKSIGPSEASLLPFRCRVRYPCARIVWGNKKTILALSRHKEILA
jgi:hypothetical protein